MKYLFIDTETTGTSVFGSGYQIDPVRVPKSSFVVQVSWKLVDDSWTVIDDQDFIIQPHGYMTMPERAEAVHQISFERAQREGADLRTVLGGPLLQAIQRCDAIVAHNASFDIKMILTSAHRAYLYEIYREALAGKQIFCTQKNCRTFCLAQDKNGRIKNPRLSEVYKKVFGEDFENAHNAVYDVVACMRVFQALTGTINWTPDFVSSSSSFSIASEC